MLDAFREEDLQGNAAEVGGHLKCRLQELATRHPLIGTVHGLGLYLGVEFVRDHDTLEPATEETPAICDRLLELGVVMQPTGDHQNVLKTKPPLSIDARRRTSSSTRSIGCSRKAGIASCRIPRLGACSPQ